MIWNPGGRFDLTSGGHAVAAIDVRDHVLTLTVGAETWRMPYVADPVRIIADGPILEVSSRAGVLAAAIRPNGDSLAVDADGDFELHRLHR